MAVYFWYLVKRDFSSLRVFMVAYNEKVTFYKVPEKHGHVYLVGLNLPLEEDVKK